MPRQNTAGLFYFQISAIQVVMNKTNKDYCPAANNFKKHKKPDYENRYLESCPWQLTPK